MPIKLILAIALLFAPFLSAQSVDQQGGWDDESENHRPKNKIQLGNRPYYLIKNMDENTRLQRKLKRRLQSCANGPFYKTNFSIGHRGAPLQYPEHTKESYEAAARMGAGILECDVTFTKDKELVCRHSQCDLHTTTNILATPLAKKCSLPFTPADLNNNTPASAKCCTSDITLAEFKTLTGKMDSSNPRAKTVTEYLGGTAAWRTDLYATNGTLLSHKESIALFKRLGAKFSPELKSAAVKMPYQGYTQENYAQHMLDEYKQAGIPPDHVWPQSFNLNDILYWIKQEPNFGEQAVFLDDRVYNDPRFEPSLSDFERLVAQGVNIVAPPMFALVTLNAQNEIIPSDYTRFAKAAGLEIITWTLERSGRLVEDMKEGNNTFYYQTILEAIDNDGDMMTLLDVLARQVRVLGIFSDWPATVTYYANCMNLK